jgi:hypothetical protein
MTESIEKVINFVKRIELLTVEPNQDRGSEGNSSKKKNPESSFQSISEANEEEDESMESKNGKKK